MKKSLPIPKRAATAERVRDMRMQDHLEQSTRRVPKGGRSVPRMKSSTWKPWCLRGVRSTFVKVCGLEAMVGDE